MRQKIGRSGMAKKLGPDAPHTLLTSVTVSVSDDEVHYFAHSERLCSYTRQTRLSNMVHHGICPPAAHENI